MPCARPRPGLRDDRGREQCRESPERHTSPPCPRRSTCPRPSGKFSSAGGTTRGSTARWNGRPQARCGRSTRDRRPRTACPGVHHIEARGFKDVFPRFKTMEGCYVPRQAGWDCHGLPVEVAVEKELGLSGKKDIEAYGIAAFNQRCRESVLRYVDAFEELTTRLGYWIDLSSAYKTMDAAYIESVWWSLK